VLDVAVTGGTLVDGTGAARRRADVGIRDGRVVAVAAPGRLGEPAAATLAVDGLVVAPGIVDVHTHYDAQLAWDPLASPSLHHGVTTVIGGNCGFTLAPLTPAAAEYVVPMLARVEGLPLPALESALDLDWTSFGGWLDRFEDRLSVNAGFLVGHSTIRRVVMGEAALGGPASDAQVAAMVDLVRVSLAEGALGFSSSRAASHVDHRGTPVPSRMASREELLALAAEVGHHEGAGLAFIPSVELTFTEDDRELMTAMALAAGRTLNWNVLGVRPGEEHLRATKLAASDHAAARGARVVGLTLPDVVDMRLNLLTGVAYDTTPGWGDVMALPLGRKLRALRDPAVRDRLRAGARELPGRPWTRFADTTIGDTVSPANEGLRGRRIGDLAAARGADALDVLLDVALQDDLRTGFYPPVTGDDDQTWAARAALWRDPRLVVGGTDAGAHVDMLHTFVATTRLLGDAVRDRRLVTLEEAVHLVTDVPARLAGLRGRGRIVEGAWADVIVFDADRLTPGPVTACHDVPGGAWRLHGEAVGLEHVLVNGRPVLTTGRPTGATPGRVLRRGRDTTSHPRL
jgi:N-acyl-D-aspartate/D-glutamate deacylase